MVTLHSTSLRSIGFQHLRPNTPLGESLSRWVSSIVDSNHFYPFVRSAPTMQSRIPGVGVTVHLGSKSYFFG